MTRALVACALVQCFVAAGSHAAPLLASGLAAATSSAEIEKVQYVRGPRFPGDTVEFRNPKVRGAFVDQCATWAQGCGEGGADQYCRYRNFSRALAWAIVNPGQTFVLGSSRYCTGAQCRGFSYIKCG